MLILKSVISRISSIDFSFEFDLHSFDCGAPDCYTTYVKFSIPFSDSIIFPSILKIREQTSGSCLEGNTPEYFVFYLAEKSNNFLIYNSRGGKKSLVLNRNNDFESKAFYFSAIDYPINLRNVESLLEYDENTKQSEIPFRSSQLAFKI